MKLSVLRSWLMASTGVAVMVAGPAWAQQDSECARQLDQMQEELQQGNVPEQRRGDVQLVIEGARTLAESGDEQGCERVSAELDQLMQTLTGKGAQAAGQTQGGDQQAQGGEAAGPGRRPAAERSDAAGQGIDPGPGRRFPRDGGAAGPRRRAAAGHRDAAGTGRRPAAERSDAAGQRIRSVQGEDSQATGAQQARAPNSRRAPGRSRPKAPSSRRASRPLTSRVSSRPTSRVSSRRPRMQASRRPVRASRRPKPRPT